MLIKVVISVKEQLNYEIKFFLLSTKHLHSSLHISRLHLRYYRIIEFLG